MLDVSEKTVQKWKVKMIKEEFKSENTGEDETIVETIGDEEIVPKEEYIIEYLD